MRRASFKCETPQLKLKSSRTFLAIKRCEGTKIGKLLSNNEAENKSGAIYGTIVVFLLSCFNQSANIPTCWVTWQGREWGTITADVALVGCDV
jgi:hypothetical protein